MSLASVAKVPRPTSTIRLVRKPEVLRRTGLASSTLYAHIAQGRFPKPVKIGARAVAWRSDEIQAWIDSRPVAELREEAAE